LFRKEDMDAGNGRIRVMKTTLKAEVGQEAREMIYNDTSCPLDKPESGKIAVKDLGDEIIKVFSVAGGNNG
jgi:adenine-specific DNA-methyltransferase